MTTAGGPGRWESPGGEPPEAQQSGVDQTAEMVAVPGTVYLVGAGPGDPGLLTVRGRALLETADCVVTDALVSEAVLALARPDAEIVDVGKRGGGRATPQEEIEALLVRQARAGRSVVRLKGGDPFVFGRGGEECEALAAAGVPYEVVSGVTSALAAPAAAGIPVTHRDWASHVTILTGHERDDTEGSRIDPALLARLLPTGTLVVLMGARTLPDLVARLLAAGADPTTPAAAIQWGTDPRQRVCVATLALLPAEVERAGLGSPMVTVVGAVAALARRASPALPLHGRRIDARGAAERRAVRASPTLPLRGRRIVVTRARPQASTLTARLEALGAEVVEVPVLAVEPSLERHDLVAAVQRLREVAGRPRWLVLTSQNAVGLLWESIREAGGDARWFADVRIAAIGPATAAELARCGLVADLGPVEYVAEALAEEMIRVGVEGAHVLLPRAAAARDVLPRRLSDAGADVEVVPIYRVVVPPGTSERLRDELAIGPVDAVTFTSSSTVSHFLTALAGASFPSGAIAACIGPITARAAVQAGFPVAVVAEEYTVEGLVAALVAHFAARSGASARGG
jgi:uroporphyrinogen III methyltransferase/synthase